MTTDPAAGPSPDDETRDAQPRRSSDSLLDRFVESLTDPELIGPYRLLERLGEGGFGIVYLAEQSEPVQRRVALKLVKPGVARNAEAIARFKAERQALAMMKHRNVASIYDAGTTEDGRPFFVMEYVKGDTVDAYCDRHSFPTRKRLELFAEICDGVQHAHHKGIIHRDIKPSNVLITVVGEEPIPKVIDFGIAKAIHHPLTADTIHTEIGAIIGTLDYMSPEQALKTSEDIDTRSDVYSLGVLMYELLVGVTPFDRGRLKRLPLDEALAVIRDEAPLPPSARLKKLGKSAAQTAGRRSADVRTLLRELRRDVDWITLRALEKDPLRRYSSATEFAKDIRQFLDNRPVVAVPTRISHGLYRTRKLLRRKRRALALIAAVVAVGVVVVFASLGSYTDSLLREARESERTYESTMVRVNELRSGWTRAFREAEGHVPAWERQAELRTWRELVAAIHELESRHRQAHLGFSKLLAVALPLSRARSEALQALDKLYADTYRITELRHGIPKLANNIPAQLREEHETVSFEISSQPPGANVYAFQYREFDGRSVPLACNPSRGHVGERFLKIETVRQSSKSRFERHDRLVSVDGREIRTRGELASVLSEVQAGQSIRIVVKRQGEEQSFAWTPFTRSQRKHIGDFFGQLGIGFAGYPLDFGSDNLIGTTPTNVTLQRGSYLLVFRKNGREDVRYPVAVPGLRETRLDIRLYEKKHSPLGFVRIPAGSFMYGESIRDFTQALKPGRRDLGGFFIGRDEVTVAEYLEFVNDPEILSRTDIHGNFEPISEGVRSELSGTDKTTVRLIPFYVGEGKLWWTRDGGGAWATKGEFGEWNPDWPIWSIPQLAAREFAAWRTRKAHRKGEPWTYRLPRDIEWEQAARGADLRTHVWGNYPIWSFCVSGKGVPTPSPANFGFTPFDESVFGVRKLAGSVSEYTVGRTLTGARFVAVRGGNWETMDDYRFRITTREGLLPESPDQQNGFRLVAVRE